MSKRVVRYDPLTSDGGGQSHLAYQRKRRGVTQEELAAAVGISIRTYRRLEQGKIDDPGVRVLHNCAIALGVTLDAVIPPEWDHWTVFNEEASGPPKWEEFFHPEREESDGDPTVDPPRQWAATEEEWVSARREALERLARKLEG